MHVLPWLKKKKKSQSQFIDKVQNKESWRKLLRVMCSKYNNEIHNHTVGLNQDAVCVDEQF